MKKCICFASVLSLVLMSLAAHAQVPFSRAPLIADEADGVLRIPNVPNVLSTELVLNSFEGTNGSRPVAGLTLGPDGYFYGVTEQGGDKDFGTVFKVAPGGVITTLVSFNGANGAFPAGKLALGPDGNFYGTTTSGPIGQGTIFKMTPEGVLTTLAEFVGSNGKSPVSGLALGSDGNFYGVTANGGPYVSSAGTIFKVTSAGVLTTLVAFKVSNGKEPHGDLFFDKDGYLYGTTRLGGAFAAGTVFKVNLQGELTTLVSFDHKNGAYPEDGPIQGKDGNFYGMTRMDLNRNSGTIFKLTREGVLSTLVTFQSTNGGNPIGGLTLGADGNFYGTTELGRTPGTAFKLTPQGELTTLVAFTGPNGSHPHAGLVQGPNGMFYGTTIIGGTNGKGVVFALSVPKPQKITFPKIAQGKVGETVRLQATASSGLPVSYRTVAGSVSPAGDPSLYRLDTAGRLVLAASQPGNLEFAAAPEVLIGIPVEKGEQRLSRFSVIANRIFSTEPFSIELPVASSGLPVSVRVKSGHAKILDNKVTLTGVGAVTLAANQRGDVNYLPSPEVTTSFLVKKASQTITLPEFEIPGIGDVVELAGTASSGLPVSYTVTGAATISGNNLSVTGEGRIVLKALQPGSDSYNPAPVVSLSFLVKKLGQTITLPEIPNPAPDAVLSLQGRASSGLPVSYTVTGAATVSGNTLTVTGMGQIVLKAGQAGNDKYAAAPTVTRILKVVRPIPTTTTGTTGGSVTFSGINTYTGGTMISNGTLTLNSGSLGGVVVNASGATLNVLSGASLTKSGIGSLSLSGYPYGYLYSGTTSLSGAIFNSGGTLTIGSWGGANLILTAEFSTLVGVTGILTGFVGGTTAFDLGPLSGVKVDATGKMTAVITTTTGVITFSSVPATKL